MAFDSKGNLYVSDGYANTRVVKFDKAGNYLTTWGTAGSGPGQFRVPHSIGVDSKDWVFVSDRENNRIQIFDANGKLLRIWDISAARRGSSSPRRTSCVIAHSGQGVA